MSNLKDYDRGRNDGLALESIGKQLRSDMGIALQEEWEGAIDGILKLVKNDLMEE